MKGLIKTAITGFLFVTAILYAQGRPNLELDIQERKINLTDAEAGGEADITYTPGDTIEFVILAKNTGDGVMVTPEIVDPVPEGTAYVAGSARGENCQIFFSIDDGFKYTEWPVMIQITNDEGTRVGQTARPDQVTHIKWLVNENIPAGGEKNLVFRVMVR